MNKHSVLMSLPIALLVLGSCGSTTLTEATDAGISVDREDPSPTSTPDVAVAQATCPSPTPEPTVQATATPSLDDIPPPPDDEPLGTTGPEPTIDATTAAIMAAGPTTTPTPQIPPTPSFAIGTEVDARSPMPEPADLSPGTFVLNINGAETIGSGIAFLEPDGVFLRLIAGSESEYLQFNQVGEPNGEPQAVRSTPAVIYGGDAVGEEYRPADGVNLNTHYEITDGGDGTVYGRVTTTACQLADGAMIRMTGVYRVAVDISTEWTCDWGASSITNCRFIDS